MYKEIGQYRIIKDLGEGGFGKVYKVEKDGKEYALKICSKSEFDDLKRFQREIRLLSAINHPNVIEIIEDNIEDEPLYYVMPLCEMALSKKLYANDIHKIDDLLSICDGIDALHKIGIIHRDIKPLNILIQGDTIKVSDLGLGKFEIRDSSEVTTARGIGSPGFVPPEFYKPYGLRDATVQSDIYQLGKTIYSIYTGDKCPEYIDNTKINNGLLYIIKKCIRPKKEERYQTVEELRNALVSHKDIIIGTKNPHIIFDKLLSSYASEDIITLFSVLYEFQNRPITFYEKANLIPENTFYQLSDGDIRIFIDIYGDTINELDANGSLSWDETEKIARQMIKIFNSTTDIDIKTIALEIALDYAIRNNRWEAMRIFYSMLPKIKTENEASQVANMLEHNLDKFQTILNNVEQQKTLHPYLEAVVYKALK